MTFGKLSEKSSFGEELDKPDEGVYTISGLDLDSFKRIILEEAERVQFNGTRSVYVIKNLLDKLKEI